jgi:DNA-binding CsgD family transcriptional regulator
VEVETSNANISTLYRALDLRGVLDAAEPLCKPGRVWCLTWPTVSDRQILVASSGGEPVDLLIARQVEQIQLPFGPSRDELGKWCKCAVSLLAGQFPWMSDSIDVDAAFRGGSPMALVGVAGPCLSGPPLAGEIARAVERTAILDSALQDGAIYRHLLAFCNRALLVVHENGRIVAGTVEGQRLLRIALYGSPRSPYKSFDDVLPTKYLSSILVGDTVSSHGISISGSPFGGKVNSDLIEPLVLVSFKAIEAASTGISPEKLAKLTPAQTEVFQLLIAGERNKQIGAQLSISVYTARNHVSAILHALGCGDRLELIARIRLAEMKAVTKPKLAVPQVLPTPFVEDLPVRPRRQRARPMEENR